MAKKDSAREVWKPVPSCPGYHASSKGRISTPSGEVYAARISASGYLVVSAKRIGAKRTHNTRVHRMVCEAFHGPAPSKKHHAAHNDGVKANCAPSNLRWATPKENWADRRLHGTDISGERHYKALMNRYIVAEIRAVHSESVREQQAQGKVRARRGILPELAWRFGVSVSTVNHVLANRTWRDPEE